MSKQIWHEETKPIVSWNYYQIKESLISEYGKKHYEYKIAK